MIHEDPTFRETATNLNSADLGAFLCFSLAGTFICRKGATRYSADYTLQRKYFTVNLNVFMITGLMCAFINSGSRLQGKTANGLQWKYKDGYLRKYDFTSEYEAQTIWGYLRVEDSQ